MFFLCFSKTLYIRSSDRFLATRCRRSWLGVIVERIVIVSDRVVFEYEKINAT